MQRGTADWKAPPVLAPRNMPDRCMACLSAATTVRAIVCHGICHDSPRKGYATAWALTARPWHTMASHRQGAVYHATVSHGMPRRGLPPPARPDRAWPGRAGRTGTPGRRPETEEIDNQNAEGSKASDRRACQVKVTWTNIENIFSS